MTFAKLQRLAGPAAAAYFICTWIVAGFLREGYNPIQDAISKLAAQEAPNRAIVLSGMVTFGIGALVFSPRLRRSAAFALVVAGIASFGVAAFPCSPGCPRDGTTTDLIHSGFAALFYVAFTLTPVLQSRSRLSLLVAGVAGVALSLHGLSVANGLMQRIGITTLDVWLIYVGLTGAGLEPREPAETRT